MLEYEIINILDITPEEYAHYFSLMSENKKERIRNYAHENDRKRSIAGEMVARRLLSQQTGLPQQSLQLSEGENGKPYLINNTLFFNISHCEQWVLCAVSERQVGADIEKIREIPLKLPSRFFTEEENNYILQQGISEKERQKRFFAVWTWKEAALKKQGNCLAQLTQNDFFQSAGETLQFENADCMISIVLDS